jgi:DNA-binding HxlR family transcriptional regulator
MRKVYTPATAAVGVEEVLKLLEGRWKLIILFHLFDGKVQRYSDFEKLISGISQKMLAQQLRRLEADGIVARKVYPQVPPKVEYRLTEWGQSLCPALDALLKWAEQRDSLVNPAQQGAAADAAEGAAERRRSAHARARVP